MARFIRTGFFKIVSQFSTGSEINNSALSGVRIVGGAPIRGGHSFEGGAKYLAFSLGGMVIRRRAYRGV